MRVSATIMSVLVLLSLACKTITGVEEIGESQSREDRATIESPAEPIPQSNSGLSEVDSWLYMIDVNLSDAYIENIAASEYDLVVLDYISSEEFNTDFPMAEVINMLHSSANQKLVLAYIDIGEAESYRTYWQSDWRVGDPEWIAGEDPDGWTENYPVAFWNDGWRDIWLGQDGLLQAIVDAGFDGIYLDWVEAYSDENVLDIAAKDGVDAREEMIWWVSDLAEFGRNQRQDFLVVAQNAAELVQNDYYVNVIDAIAQEQTWFDGGADNLPAGDCPLPRTEQDIDSHEYRDGLSPACRRQYDSFPDSTLHVSSEWYLDYLEIAREKGLTVFTVDYALDQNNIDWIYDTSRDHGFIPFVSNRALDLYLDPY